MTALALAVLFGLLAGSVATFVGICWLAYRSGIGPPDVPAQPTPPVDLEAVADDILARKTEGHPSALEAARYAFKQCHATWTRVYDAAVDEMGIGPEEAFEAAGDAMRFAMDMLMRSEVEALRDALVDGTLRLEGEGAEKLRVWLVEISSAELLARDAGTAQGTP